jgi:polysaccharide biosynthesis protein PslH
VEQLLFLTQRIPYPPDKGDKIRAWQILSHFAKSYRVHLGCFCDDPADLRHVPFLEGVCASLCCRPLSPKRAKLKSLATLGSGKPLTLGYFADAALRQWVDATVAAHRPSRIFVFCSAMAPYALPHRAAIRILDMVDVDSDKWRQYAATKAWPASAIYAREYRTLLAFERKIAGEFDATLLVSRAEADFFKRLAPESAARVMAFPNGVDAAHFDPGRPYADPYPAGVRALCYTGAMDYWPNIDAVSWFAERVMPLLAARASGLEFWIVGAKPAPAVERLARLPAVRVTGRVGDVRPYIAHAAAIVAPLQIARGVQNKVLEGMAMARPVVLTPQAGEGLDLVSGRDALVAADARGFALRLDEILDGRHPQLGARARQRVMADYQWNFAHLDEIISGYAPAAAAAG